MKTKVCVDPNHKGERELPLVFFQRYFKSPDGRRNKCSVCTNNHSKQRRKETSGKPAPGGKQEFNRFAPQLPSTKYWID